MRLHHMILSALLLMLVFVQGAAAQSLADVARAEAARRERVKGPVKVYTNESLGGGGTAPAPAAPAAGAPASATEKPEAEKPAAEDAGPPKDETYWRGRIAALRNAAARNQVLADALQSRINALNADFSNTDDPVQRGVVERNRRTALAELDRMNLETEKLNKEIAAVEEEARKANVPPGWLR